MFPSLESIQAMTNYSALIHLKSRMENRFADLKKQHIKLLAEHRAWARSVEGKKFYARQKGMPQNKKELSAKTIEVNACFFEAEAIIPLHNAVLARLDVVSPPPVEVPKKIRLYDEPWHG